MDIKIKDGDMVLDSTGAPVKIEGTEEILQQIVMRITAKKGGFIYNKEMGTEAVTDVSGDRECRRLEVILQEAVADMEDISLRLDCASQLVDGRILAELTVACKENIMSLEVII
ncbi:MAG: hypothetical protein IJD93_06280 [Ruminococcus sp.]|nr:hypothetical protein [Ruminococcus sp.]